MAQTHVSSAAVRSIGIAVAALGAVVLAGWVLDIPMLRSALPGAAEMKVNTAIGLSLAGLALLLIGLPGRTGRAVARALAIAVMGLGVATLGQYVLNLNLGLDEWLLSDPGGAFAGSPGRMSPYSTLAFIGLGLGLCVLTIRRPSRLAHLVGTLGTGAAGLVGVVTLMGYLWRASELVTDVWLPPVAVHTALGFVLLSVGTWPTVRGVMGPATGGAALHVRVGRPVLTAFLASMLFLIVVGGFAYRSVAGLVDSTEWVASTLQVRAALDELYAELADAELAQRNYLFTGDATFDAAYAGSVDRLHSDAQALAAMVTRNTEQAQYVTELRDLMTRRLEILDQQRAAFRDHGLDEATRQIASGEGSERMRAVRVLKARMDDIESRLLDDRRRALVASRVQALVGLLVTFGVGLVGFVTIFLGVRRGLVSQVQAETALRASEENLAVTLQSIGDGVLATDDQGRVTRLNRVAEQLTGWTEAAARGRRADEVFTVVNEFTRAPGYLPIADTLAKGIVHGLANHTVLIALDGTEVPIADSCAPIRDGTGRVVGAVLAFRDVTIEQQARTQAEQSQRRLRELNQSLEERVEERTQKLNESRQRFETLCESAPDALLVSDASGLVTMANGEAVRLFGWSRAELVGRPLQSLIPGGPDDRPRGSLQQPLRAVRRDGSECPVELSQSPMRTDDGPCVVTAVRDVTERIHLEAQFRQAQRMETVGQLAGGIAHDFNNLLTVINGTAELAALDLDPNSPTVAELVAIRDAGARAATLTRQLLTFSRQQVLQPRLLNLNSVVEDVEPMLRRLIGDHITVSLSLAEDLSNVKADPGQMEQVVLNLSVNARDAMPEGGTLTIETRHAVLDDSYVLGRDTVVPGHYVMLAVSDTGVGMDESTRRKIFEPFFTTKGIGKGTGLGLATVYGIVRQSGGDIWTYSELGKGTTMKIYLPMAADGVAGQEADVEPVLATGSETILVVEDEESLRRVAERILTNAGYKVLAAPTGARALEMIAAHDGPVHLVLTDVLMPGMSGRELVNRLEASHSSTRILYTSGYTDDAIAHHGVLDSDVHFLSKPYSVQQLSRKVREVLDAE